MANVIITKESNGWDISVYEDGKKAKTAWAMNRDQAIGKAEILGDYYSDDNGQRAGIVINERS